MNQYNRNNLCRSFVAQAQTTWTRLGLELTTNISIGEETFTDINLQDLQAQNTLLMTTKKFKRHQEAKNGADWEWWLLSAGKGFGLRVQAKKLDLSTSLYPELDKSNKYGPQIDLLIREARRSSPRRFPLYVFYNYWDTYKQFRTSNCRSLPNDPTTLGCSIVPANVIRNSIGTKNVGITNIETIMLPWHCLICCTGFSGLSQIGAQTPPPLPETAFAFLLRAFPQPNNDNSRITAQDFGAYVTDELPTYVRDILEGRDLSEDQWEAIGLNRVVLINEG